MKDFKNYHISILAGEIERIVPEKGVIVDATLGGGGHSGIIFEKLKEGQVISIDRDDDAIQNAVLRFGLQKVDEGSFQLKRDKKSWIVEKGNFGNIKDIVNKLSIEEVSMILADLGVSSHQIDDPKRGFSFMDKGPIDMRMDKNQELSAKDLVNGLQKKELERIFSRYGEERYASEIADAIVRGRSYKQITNTIDIVEIIKKTVGEKYESSKHPARRVFQALRIAVNDEMGELERFCKGAKELIDQNGVIVILTFHSLERNIIEEFFSDWKIKKLIPSDDEISRNSRAKSAIGYVITK